MRLVWLAVVLGALSAATPGLAVAQERPVQLEALPSASRSAVLEWLQRDCSMAATPQESARLRALPGIAQEILIEAYRQGPPPELLRAYQTAFVEAFEARNEVLAREGTRLFGADDAARLQAINRDSYVRRRLEAARLNYRTNAVIGLGVIGARGALPLLDQIAGEPGNQMREAALGSIAALRESQPAAPAQSR